MPLFSSSSAEPELIEKIDEIQKNQDPFWLANSLQGFGTGTMPCVRDRLGELPMPVQLLIGEKDSKFLHINRQMEKEITNSELAVVKEAGHRVHLDQPETFVSHLKSFIQKNTTP